MNRSFLAVAAALMLFVAACGGSSEDAASDDVSTDEAVSTVDPITEGDDPAPATTAPMTESATESTTAPTTESGDASARRRPLGESVLARTLDPATEFSSARFEGSFTFVGAPGSELPGQFAMGFSGAYDLAKESSDITIDFSDFVEAALAGEGGAGGEMATLAAFFEDPLRIVSIGDESWIQWSLISMFAGQDDVWVEADADDSSDLTSDFGFGGSGSPSEMLRTLEHAEADIEELGTETVRGVETNHIRAVIDVDAFSATMTAEERADFEAEMGGSGIDELPIEFWVDGEGLVRRFQIDLADPSFDSETDGELESAQFVFEMWDFGADVGIAAPPADSILAEDELNLGFGN